MRFTLIADVLWASALHAAEADLFTTVGASFGSVLANAPPPPYLVQAHNGGRIAVSVFLILAATLGTLWMAFVLWKGKAPILRRSFLLAAAGAAVSGAVAVTPLVIVMGCGAIVIAIGLLAVGVCLARLAFLPPPSAPGQSPGALAGDESSKVV
jgi:hypothetical protein